VRSSALCSSNKDENEYSDFDGYVGDSFDEEETNEAFVIPDFDVVDDEKDDRFSMSNILKTSQTTEDRSACRARQFQLGQDLSISAFAGSLGFEEVTDWEYYYESEDGDDRKVVSPSPLDPSKPRRTRESSGSVVRLFRGEFGGRLGATLRAQGLDARVLVKEFSGTLALELAQAELETISALQSNLLTSNKVMDSMVQTAMARTTLTRQDDGNLCTLLQLLQQAPFTGILGEINIAELLDDFDKNEWYRAFSVPPPKPDSIWIVYEYTGLSTVAAYAAQPASVRIAKLPPQRGMFGNVVAPPAVPPFSERFKYIRLGIIQQALEAVATLHEAGIVHNSIGKSSILLYSKALDKNEASSAYATNLSRILIKLADFGFSVKIQDATRDEAFLSRARSFGLQFKKGEISETARAYAMAEDLHALGVAVLGMLLSSLAEVPSPDYKMPDTNEDTLQRLLTDIFDKDMQQFRDYVEAEEIWSSLVEYLDEYEGWDFLAALLLARENAAAEKSVSAQELLSSSRFLQRSN
jgi:serine/threonine protein kinase